MEFLFYLVKLIFLLLHRWLFKIIGIVLYPLAYYMREIIRGDDTQNDELYEYFQYKWLWYLLDDSIHIEDGVDYSKNLEYKYLKTDFLKSWYWSAWRNSLVNYYNYNAYGKLVYYRWLKGSIEDKKYIGLGFYASGKLGVDAKYETSSFKFRVGFTSGTGRFEDLTIRRKS